MVSPQANDFALADAVKDFLDLALGKRRVAVTSVPVVEKDEDVVWVERDGAQELSGHPCHGGVAIVGMSCRRPRGPIGGVMALAVGAARRRQPLDQPIRRR